LWRRPRPKLGCGAKERRREYKGRTAGISIDSDVKNKTDCLNTRTFIYILFLRDHRRIYWLVTVRNVGNAGNEVASERKNGDACNNMSRYSEPLGILTTIYLCSACVYLFKGNRGYSYLVCRTEYEVVWFSDGKGICLYFE
jgi:hypothetical protein